MSKRDIDVPKGSEAVVLTRSQWVLVLNAMTYGNWRDLHYKQKEALEIAEAEISNATGKYW